MGYVEPQFPLDSAALHSTICELLTAQGAAREVALLVAGEVSILHLEHDNWDGGQDYWGLRIDIAPGLYARIQEEERNAATNTILAAAKVCMTGYPGDHITEVILCPRIVRDERWREKAAAWLRGENITNQGRVRSDNIAAREADGLLFRSKPEIMLYRALREKGVAFAPLAVFVRGGAQAKRIEPDFFVVHNRTALVIEVDGDTVHQESPVDAHQRLTMLTRQGVEVERVRAEECATPEGARAVADRVMQLLNRAGRALLA